MAKGQSFYPLFLLLSACGGPPTPTTPDATCRPCGSECRPQLTCESEFAYDGRKATAGFTVAGVGVQGATERQAIRQIDQETERYVALAKRLCDEYNKCVLDRETYATRSENMRRRIARVPELAEQFQRATTDQARRQALAEAYDTAVPSEARTDISLDFAVHAKKPGDDRAHAIASGTSLPTNTRLHFTLRASRTAHLYVFQRGPDGKVQMLFPHSGINLANPIAASTVLRIPQGEQTYRLNERDLGTEQVFLVASVEPLADPGGAGTQVTGIARGSSGCRTRALELDAPAAAAAPGCVRSRGIELAPDQANEDSSLRVRTEAGDSKIADVFTFEHTR
jgi:hypothetical protein